MFVFPEEKPEPYGDVVPTYYALCELDTVLMAITGSSESFLARCADSCAGPDLGALSEMFRNMHKNNEKHNYVFRTSWGFVVFNCSACSVLLSALKAASDKMKVMAMDRLMSITKPDVD